MTVCTTTTIAHNVCSQKAFHLLLTYEKLLTSAAERGVYSFEYSLFCKNDKRLFTCFLAPLFVVQNKPPEYFYLTQKFANWYPGNWRVFSPEVEPAEISPDDALHNFQL